jgi:hypothetical protein
MHEEVEELEKSLQRKEQTLSPMKEKAEGKGMKAISSKWRRNGIFLGVDNHYRV